MYRCFLHSNIVIEQATSTYLKGFCCIQVMLLRHENVWAASKRYQKESNIKKKYSWCNKASKLQFWQLQYLPLWERNYNRLNLHHSVLLVSDTDYGETLLPFFQQLLAFLNVECGATFIPSVPWNSRRHIPLVDGMCLQPMGEDITVSCHGCSRLLYLCASLGAFSTRQANL